MLTANAVTTFFFYYECKKIIMYISAVNVKKHLHFMNVSCLFYFRYGFPAKRVGIIGR